MPFGQLVFGHPGAGKTTYCTGLQSYLSGLKRKVKVVNLDPANDELPYDAAVDIRELVDHSEVMEAEHLGPNGSFLFCLDYLSENFDWLAERLSAHEPESYYLFDCPGQVELYTHHDNFRDLVDKIQRKAHIRLCAVHLVDSLYVRSGTHFISALLLSLTTMLQLELPHINVMSKIDLLGSYGLAFRLDFYTEVHDLSHMLHHMASDESIPPRFHALNAALVQLIDDFPHVSFATLDIQNKESVMELMTQVDRANGFAFEPMQNQPNTQALLSTTAAATLQSSYLDRFEASTG